MPNSFAQTVSLTCPQCSQGFEAPVWLVVDAAARPDLIEKIEQETIHDLPCPACSSPDRVDAPSSTAHRAMELHGKDAGAP